MQQLQNASDPLRCAERLLDAVLEILVTVREQCAKRHGSGPTLVQLRALGTLRKRPGSTLSTLSNQLALTVSATSRLVDSLVARRLVKRQVPPGNRRTVSLMLTAAGVRSLGSAMRETHRELAIPLQRLSASERQALAHSLALLQSVVTPPPSPQSPSPRRPSRSRLA